MESLDNGRGLIAADKFYQVPGRKGVFACGDIIRPHLLTTVIGQGSIAAESIDRYLRHEEMAKRPKVDVHHFNLLDKLREADLEPEAFAPSSEPATRRSTGLRGTSEAGKGVGGFAVHNYEDRAPRGLPVHGTLPRALQAGAREAHRDRPVTPRRCWATSPSASWAGRQEDGGRSQALHELRPVLRVRQLRDLLPADGGQAHAEEEATMGRYVYTDYALCIGCHICADVCPTGYIKMGMGDHDMRAARAAALVLGLAAFAAVAGRGRGRARRPRGRARRCRSSGRGHASSPPR